MGLDGEFLRAFQGEGAPVKSIDNLLDRLESEEFDLVAVGRALLQDPEWARKILQGRYDTLKPYDAASLKTLHRQQGRPRPARGAGNRALSRPVRAWEGSREA